MEVSLETTYYIRNFQKKYEVLFFMLEPISGFFILLGLSFDIVGAFLIASAIIAFKSTWTPFLIKQREAWKNIVNPFIPTSQEIGSNIFSKERLEEMRETNLLIKKASVEFSKELQLDITKQEKKFTKKRTRLGLPFLIGGFLLQGIGTIFQLF